MAERPKCERCEKPIRKFTVTKDWDSRRYHKKCWEEMQEIKQMYERMDEYDGAP